MWNCGCFATNCIQNIYTHTADGYTQFTFVHNGPQLQCDDAVSAQRTVII